MTTKKTGPHHKAGRKNKHAPVTKQCPICGKDFDCKTAYQIEKQTYCDRQCRSVAVGNGRSSPRTARACKKCDAEMSLRPCDLPTKFFCSYACSNSFNNSGENNAAWKGGNDKYWKRTARERDNFTCQFPGCGFRHEGHATHAHHKFPRAAGGTDDLTNLITLCGKHHGHVEALFLRRLNELHPGIVEAVVTEIYDGLAKGIVGLPLQPSHTVLKPK